MPLLMSALRILWSLALTALTKLAKWLLPARAVRDFLEGSLTALRGRTPASRYSLGRQVSLRSVQEGADLHFGFCIRFQSSDFEQGAFSQGIRRRLLGVWGFAVVF